MSRDKGNSASEMVSLDISGVRETRKVILIQQTFVLMRASWGRLPSSSSEDVFQEVLIKTNIFILVICLQKTSSRRLAQDQYFCLGHTSSRSFQDVFKTFSRRLQDVFKTSLRRFQDVFKMSSSHLQDVFKSSSRRLAKTSSRYLAKISWRQLQDVFKLNCSC